MTNTLIGPPQTLNYPPIPAWEIASLQQLAANDKLSGLPPQIVAVLASAESSGQGGGVNPQGYGGWFGLAANTTYPAGATTTSLLKGTDPASFATQAEIAASAFASYLTQTGGNPVAAEQIYQTGSASGSPGEGAQLMAQYTGGQTIVGSSPQTSSVPLNSPTPTDCKPIIGEGGVLGIGSATLLNSCQAQEIVGALLMGVGALALIVGFGIVLADVGLRKSAPAIVGAVIGRSSGRRSAERESGATANARRTYEREGSTSRREYNRAMNQGESRSPRPITPKATPPDDF